MEEIFFQISLVLIVGTACATIAKLLRQPMIPAYILAGVILGPPLLHIIDGHSELMESLSTFGISFLLFLVGMELDVRKLMKSGKVAIAAGFAQMIVAVGVGYGLIRVLGFTSSDALFLALALGFSSTIVELKLLGERKEIDTLHGQLLIGLLLTQDFIAIAFLIFFEVFTGDAGGAELVQSILVTLLKGGVLVGAALLSARYILTHVFKYFAKTAELLFLGAISWCLVFAMMAVYLGFSVEVGSLLAGVSLSFVPYTVSISNRVRSLRDFFLPIFFAVLGAQLVFSGTLFEILVPTLSLSALVLFFSPLVVVGLLLWFGYRASTSFRVGNTIGQVSEFSFIVVALGYSSGVIGQDIVALVALIGLVTMTLSTYMISYTDELYAKFRPFIKRFERKNAGSMNDLPDALTGHTVIFGYHTMGYRFHEVCAAAKKEVVVVDNNPEVIALLDEKGIPHVYGSISDEEVLEHARVEHAATIISTVASVGGNSALLAYVDEKDERKRQRIIVTATDSDDALTLYEEGAGYVIYPTSLPESHMNNLLSGPLSKRKKAHISELNQMQKLYGL